MATGFQRIVNAVFRKRIAASQAMKITTVITTSPAVAIGIEKPSAMNAPRPIAAADTGVRLSAPAMTTGGKTFVRSSSRATGSARDGGRGSLEVNRPAKHCAIQDSHALSTAATIRSCIAGARSGYMGRLITSFAKRSDTGK